MNQSFAQQNICQMFAIVLEIVWFHTYNIRRQFQCFQLCQEIGTDVKVQKRIFYVKESTT